MDVLKLATVEDRGEPDVTWYGIAPGTLYPVAIEDLRRAIAGDPPKPQRVRADNEIVPNELLTLWDQARALPDEAWDLALGELPRSQKDRELRAQALELARLWFTEHLHRANDGRPIGLHILRDERWRL